MYKRSTAFATAIRERKRQHALVLFPSSLFYLCDEDIEINGGIDYNEHFNLEDDITVGKAVESDISVSLINREKLLQHINYDEEFKAYLGVETEVGGKLNFPFQPGADLVVMLPGSPRAEVLSFKSGQARVWMRGRAYTLNGAPKAVYVLENRVYIYGDNGECLNAFERDGLALKTIAAPKAHEIIKYKVRKNGYTAHTFADNGLATYRVTKNSGSWGDTKNLPWRNANTGIWNGTGSNRTWRDALKNTWGLLRGTTWQNQNEIWQFGLASTWGDANVGHWDEGFGELEYDTTEYVPLGVFRAERPMKTKTSVVNVEAYDRMTRFDTDAKAFLASQKSAYPITIQDFFLNLCKYCGVPVNLSNRETFINGSVVIEAQPEFEEEVTCREILGYIAELSCAYARMNRDGECELAFFKPESYKLTRHDRFDLDLAEFGVTPINSVLAYATNRDIFTTLGSGDNRYYILDNPFLDYIPLNYMKGWLTVVLRELMTVPEYAPMETRVECDWAVQSGDIIEIEDEENDYYRLPIFDQSISWTGHATCTYDCTGNARRELMSAEQLESLRRGTTDYATSDQISALEARLAALENQ